MPERLKKLIRSVSKTGIPVELSFEDCEVDTAGGRRITLRGSLSIEPEDAEEAEEPGDLSFERGGLRLHCSEKETCVMDFERDELTMNVKKGSLFKDILKGTGGDASSVEDSGLTLNVKYKGMTLVRNADPESLKSFLKKL